MLTNTTTHLPLGKTPCLLTGWSCLECRTKFGLHRICRAAVTRGSATQYSFGLACLLRRNARRSCCSFRSPWHFKVLVLAPAYLMHAVYIATVARRKSCTTRLHSDTKCFSISDCKFKPPPMPLLLTLTELCLSSVGP